ncbi:MAG: glycerol-3-phosphate 1-O-acyltransferase PlsY [Clostridia bacterium]|nr:glycerol-3-phosphate 1-O-acyltransferase PlsY [Clostridia bacterium]
MNNKRIASLLLLVFMLFAVFFTVSGAEEETKDLPETAAETDVTTTGETKKEEGGFFNTFISLRENGGLVTRSFGEKTAVTFDDGTTGTSYRIPWAPYILTIVLVCAFSYIMGSINFGVLVSKKMYKDDVRNYGSGNAGMTNVLRVYGKKAALLTFLGDVFKSMICALLGQILAGNGCGYLAVVFCMIGHAFPVFYRFKGGKAVASAFGGLFALEPIATVLLLLCFIIIVGFTKYVSLASIISAALIPLFINAMWRVPLFHPMYNFDYFIVILCSVFCTCFIIWRHKSNIKRLLAGEENKTHLFDKKKKETDGGASQV